MSSKNVSKKIEKKPGIKGKEKLEKKQSNLLKEKKRERIRLALNIKEQNKAKEYMHPYKKAEIRKMLKDVKNKSVFELQRGGSLRLAYERAKSSEKKKMKIKDWQGYAQMTSMFATLEHSKKGMCLLVDLRGKGNTEEREDWRLGFGAGHLCHPKWEEVAIEDTEGNIRIGVRKIPGEPGIYGEKVGYYEKVGKEWRYIKIFTGYRIYPRKLNPNWREQAKKEEEFYKKRGKYVSKYTSIGKNFTYAPAVMPKFNDKEKQKLIEKGSYPFPVEKGYRLTENDLAWYKAHRAERRILSKMSIQDRWEAFQKKGWNLMGAIETFVDAAGINPRHVKRLQAFADGLMKCEADYSLGSLDIKDGVITRSKAVGMLQILPSTWAKNERSGVRKWFSNTRYSERYRQKLGGGINYKKLMKIDWSARRPEFATPYHHMTYVMFFITRYSRTTRGYISLDEMLDNMENNSRQEMRDSWAIAPRIMWRNGASGARPIIEKMRAGEPFPLRNGMNNQQYREKVRAYYETLPKDSWQYKRGFHDFWMLCRNSVDNYLVRYKKNCRQMGLST